MVPSRRIAVMMGADLAVAMTNTSVGLAGATLVVEDSRAGRLLLAPACVLPLAYRAHASERDLAVRIALDDFGTGHSSLQSPRELPVDMIEVAKPFGDGAARTPQDRA